MEVWHWIGIGVLLLIIEVISFGAPLLWLGAPVVVVGLVLAVWPSLGWSDQLIILAIAAVVSTAVAVIVALRRGKRPPPPVNLGIDRFIGTQATLETAIVNGRGSAQIGDTVWPVVGPDLPQGTRVIVTSTDGTLLTVRPIEPR